MVSVKYDHISIAYDDFVVVKDLSLEINDGELTTLLGPSGCGKTTLLRALAGFVEPFEGRIFFGDEDVTLLPPQKRNTAMIFQNYALWPHMTVFENVEYGLKLKGRSTVAGRKSWKAYVFWITRPFFVFVPETHRITNKEFHDEKESYLNKGKIRFWQKIKWYTFRGALSWLVIVWKTSKAVYYDYKAKIDPQFAYRRKKVFEALKLVHLEDQADKLPTQLSGGQQQRIALCRAIVVEPDVLLCDEPLSNLDAKLRKELRTEIRSIIKRLGITTVYVTHDQAEALAISDKIAVINSGKIEQHGTPTEVFQDPKTLFVAQFIGTSSTLHGKIIKENLVELDGGEQIKINPKSKIPVGTEVQLVIRPESVSLIVETDNSLEISINTIEYQGTEVKITGKLKDETILLVDVAENTEEYAKLKPGDKVKVYINTDDIFTFVDEKRVY